MNESSISQESNDSTSRAKLFGLLRPLVGVLIGILFFILGSLLIRGTDSRWLEAVWHSPGYMAILTIVYTNVLFNISPRSLNIIFYTVSSIPFAILGSLIVSKRKAIRTIGTILLLIYFAASLIAGIFVLIAGSD